MTNSILKVDQINKNSAASISMADPVVNASSQTLAAGTTSLAPLIFSTGSNLTSAAAGAIEYDGSIFYATPVTNNRAVQGNVHFTTNVGDVTLANSANAQSPFVSTNDVITLPGTTTYEMEGLITVTGMGGTTRTTALEFDAGTCTLTSIYYEATIATGAANTVSTVFNSFTAVAATAQILNATVATAAMTIRWKGLVRINVGGTFIPQIKFSADPTGTILCKKDSYFKMTPLGSNTVLAVGNWA